MRACLIAVAAISLSGPAFAKAPSIDQEKGKESPLAPVLSSIALPDEPTFPPGPGPAVPRSTAKRPAHIVGKILMAGREYTFGTGGYGRGSIPYGDFPVTPKDVGSWGSRHGAIGINHNEIADPKYRSHREGIELHPIGGRLRTEGCVGVLSDQWSSFKRDLFGMLQAFGGAWLHIWPEGAAITADREPPSAAQLIALRSDENGNPAPRVVRHLPDGNDRSGVAHHRHRYAAVHHHHHHYWRHRHYATR